MKEAVIDLLDTLLSWWSDIIYRIETIVITSPSSYGGGRIWVLIRNINSALQAIGLALLILFFVVGAVRTCTNFNDLKRPEQAFKLLLRFTLAKAAVTYNTTILLTVFDIIQGMILEVTNTHAYGSTVSNFKLPLEIERAILDCGFFESLLILIISIGGIFVIAVSVCIIMMTVMGRIFRILIYYAIAPISLSTFASESSQSTGKAFLKSYCGVIFEGIIIIIACMIYPMILQHKIFPPVTSSSAATQLFFFIFESVFYMLVLSGIVKLSNQFVKEITG